MKKKNSFGHIDVISETKFRCRWSDITGRRRSHYVHGTYHDAELYLVQQEINRYGHSENTTYKEYWSSVVLPQIETLEEKTKHEYKRLWNKHLARPLNSRVIATTNYRFAQAVIDTIEAPAVQRATATLWKKICNMAVRDGLLDSNPIHRMSYKKLERKKKQILSKDEVFPFLQQFEETSYYSLIILEMIAGLRHEEACAISDSDIEYRDGNAFISISKARVVVNGVVIAKDTKNNASVRCVPLCGMFADMIKSCSVSPRNPESATTNYKRLCARNGYRYIPFGDMRSIFATLAGECCDGSLVDLYMGHIGRTTMDKWYRASTEQGFLIVANSLVSYLCPD